MPVACRTGCGRNAVLKVIKKIVGYVFKLFLDVNII